MAKLEKARKQARGRIEPDAPVARPCAHALKREYEDQLAACTEAGRGDGRHSGREYRAMLRAVRALPAADLAADHAVWMWSDLHLGHDNIIRYANRPFADAKAMDAALYRNWDAAVDDDATLLFVGDVAMRGAVGEHTWQRIRAGRGARKRLVVGNHDLTGCGRLRVAGFDDVSALLCVAGDPPLVFTHMPLESVPVGWVNVHGHTHGAPPGRSRHINVCVEQIDYRPVQLARVYALARELAAGRYPPGGTTLERLAAVRGGQRA